MRARLSAISLADTQKRLAKIIILAPMATLLIYLAVFSQPRYMSESKVATKRSDDLNSGSLNSGLPLGAPNPSSTEDALCLEEYINSPDMLAALSKRLNFRETFSHGELGFLNHLSRDEIVEGFLKCYKDRINVPYDGKTGLLGIQTWGLSPEFALEFNQTVPKRPEHFISKISHRIARDQLALAETKMEEVRRRLDASKAELLSHRDNSNVLDPQAQAQAVSTLVNTLMGQKVQVEAGLRNSLTYLRKDASQAVSARNVIQLLQAQVDEEQSKTTASYGDELNRMAADFEKIKSKVKFSIELYKLILTSTKETRVEVVRKLKMLPVISSPQLPQELPFSNIPYLIAYWSLVYCLLFGTLRLLLAVIEDYRD